ncbi:MAG: hypothetical protein ACK4PR_07260 [Gammaproteobacteria bacterium]
MQVYNSTTKEDKSARQSGDVNPNNDEKSNNREFADIAKDGINVAKEGAQALMGKAQDEIGELKQTSDKYMEDITNYVKDNPSKSILFALAGGLLLGLLLKD